MHILIKEKNLSHQDLKLYYSPGACSLSVHVALEELGVPYKLIEVNLKQAKHLQSDYLNLNSRARVPILFYGKTRIREAVTILQFLNECFPENKLAPTDVTARALCYEWMLFGTATIHPYFGGLWRSERYASNPSHYTDIQQTCEKEILKCFTEFDEFLGDKKFLLGDHPYICDYYYVPLIRWINNLNQDKSMYINIPRYYDTLLSLPSVNEAMLQENLIINREINDSLQVTA